MLSENELAVVVLISQDVVETIQATSAAAALVLLGFTAPSEDEAINEPRKLFFTEVGDSMTDESPFRFTLLAVAVVQSAASVHCMRKAKAAATIFRRREEGIALSVLLGLFYLGYCCGVVAYLVQPQWMAWSAIGLPAWVRWAGAALLALGVVLVIWGLISLGRNFAFAVAPKEGNTLVTTGPYRWVRHPLYTAFFIEAVGIGLLMANWFVATMAGSLWVLLVFRTRQEEEELIERFGGEYRSFMAETGRFLPRLWRSSSSKLLV